MILRQLKVTVTEAGCSFPSRECVMKKPSSSSSSSGPSWRNIRSKSSGALLQEPGMGCVCVCVFISETMSVILFFISS